MTAFLIWAAPALRAASAAYAARLRRRIRAGQFAQRPAGRLVRRGLRGVFGRWGTKLALWGDGGLILGQSFL